MIPGPIVHLVLCGFHFDSPRAHVQQQVQTSIQKLYCKKVHFCVLLATGVLSFLWLPVGEENKTVWFGGTEVEGDGAHAFGVPLG
uniref:Uncharacterized protein n=1 Tax=Sinocyclocheilus rhinocerous TaxID=307959 RepID=A0A673N2Z4_9TELE